VFWRPTASAANASAAEQRRVFEELFRGVEPEARRNILVLRRDAPSGAV